MGSDIFLMRRQWHPTQQVFLSSLSLSLNCNFLDVLLLELTVDMDEIEEEKTDYAKLKQKIEALGVKVESCTPGHYDLLYCPKVFFNLYFYLFHISNSYYELWWLSLGN